MSYPDFPDLMGRIDGLISLDEAQALRRYARATTAAIVEIGAYRGRSSVALAYGVAEHTPAQPRVWSIDPHADFTGFYGGQFGGADRVAYYQNLLDSGFADRVALINLPGAAVAQIWSRPVDLLFIDGDHSLQGVTADYTAWKRHLSPQAHIIFDDALDPACGPHQLISEQVRSGHLQIVETVGKLVITVPTPHAH